ncbi:MAG: carboxypeptidase regulatory-like domain-containing protein [Planctomycetota bacterium]
MTWLASPTLILMIAGHGLSQVQAPVPTPTPARTVHVLGPDGEPLAGVPLHLESAPPRAVVDTAGWLVAESHEVSRLRGAKFLTTNPDGQVTIASIDEVGSLRVAEPYFATSSTQVRKDSITLHVDKREPVGVRVFDDQGEPLAKFPVALHADGRDMAVALTDKLGRAVLGLPAGFEARAVVAPAGWVGPKDGFPSVADTLAGSRRVTLTVPAYGSLVLRPVRGGAPTREAMTAQGFYRPTDYFPLSAPPGVQSSDAAGVRYPMVALDAALGCYSPLSRAVAGLLECRGPSRAGETRFVDMELGPLIRFRLDTGTTRHDPALLRVRLVTDAGDVVGYANRDPDDRWTLDPRRALPGTKLRRIDVDANVGLTDHKQLSGTLDCDHAHAVAAIDLGASPMIFVEPQLRGTVTDAEGRPIAGAQVHVSKIPKPNTGSVFTTDGDGRFQTTSLPIARDENGRPVQLFAQARHRGATSGFVQGVDGEVVLVLQAAPAGTAPRLAQNGRVTARLRNLPKSSVSRFEVRLVSRHGEFTATRFAIDPDGVATAEFQNLREGTYTLQVPGPARYEVAVLHDLAVPGDGECDDRRLLDLDCDQVWRKVTVQVIDRDAVPIAGARLTGDRVSLRSDGKGEIEVWLARGTPFTARISAPGQRSIDVTSWPDTQRIQLEAAGKLTIAVRGLPTDVPRERLEVWLRDPVRRVFDEPRASLPADGSDVVTLELPARGRFLPTLWLRSENERPGSGSATAVHLASEAVNITEEPSEPIEIRLSEAEIASLRQKLAK